jgi:hypothetical protein
MFPPTLPEMIADAKREVALRRSVYPRLVAAGRLKQSKADRQIAIMEAIVEKLKECASV